MTTFRPCRKKTLISARTLTHEDHVHRYGLIQTLEGPSPFEVGDALAHDHKGEWPIPRAIMERDYQRVSDPDEAGYAFYQSLDQREAQQMDAPFTCEGLMGKAGDYLVRSQGRSWIVDQALFEETYTFEEGEHA